MIVSREARLRKLVEAWSMKPCLEKSRAISNAAERALNSARLQVRELAKESLKLVKELRVGIKNNHSNETFYLYKTDPLILAASKASILVLKALLGRGCSSFFIKEEALYEAAWQGKTAAIDLLLKNGADLSFRSQRNEQNALDFAVSQGRLNTMDYILPHSSDEELDHALWVALQSEFLVSPLKDEVLRSLLIAGAEDNWVSSIEERAYLNKIRRSIAMQSFS